MISPQQLHRRGSPPVNRSFVAVPKFAKDFTLENADRLTGGRSTGCRSGPYRRQAPGAPLTLDGATLLSRGATTANIELWSNCPAGGTLKYGLTPQCESSLPLGVQQSFQTISLTGLKPDTRYYFKVRGWAKTTPVYSKPVAVF